MRTRRVVVVGGGVAGLSAAYRIREEARRRGLDVELQLLEASAGPGGKIATVREDGFLCETGPNGFLDNEPATLRLVRDLGLKEDLLRSRDAARRRYLVREGRLVEMHMHPIRFLKSPLLSFGAKLRMATEYFRVAKRDDREESVGAFGRRRLGREFTEIMLDSMVSGIYAGDVDRLSVRAAFPKIVELESEHGGLFRGMLARQRERRDRRRLEHAKKREAAAHAAADAAAVDPRLVDGASEPLGRGEDRPVQAGPAGVLHSFVDGMGEPIAALARALGEHVVRTSAAVARLEDTEDRAGGAAGPRTDEGRYRVHMADGETLDADMVVLTTPAPASSQILHGFADVAAEELGAIHVSGVHVVCLGFERGAIGADVQAFGCLVPRREGIRTLGTIFSSSTFEGRAPEGRVLLTNMIGGRHDPDADALDDEALVRQVLADVRPLLAIDRHPVFHRVFRWARGIPQYELGHLDRVQRAREDLQRRPGVLLGGNSVAGVSFNHCIAHAETLGAEVCDFLQARSGAEGRAAVTGRPSENEGDEGVSDGDEIHRAEEGKGG